MVAQGGPWSGLFLVPPPSFFLFPLRPLSFLYWRTSIMKKITLPLRAGGRVAPMGSWGSRGTPRPCNWG